MKWSAYGLNALREVGHGMSATERTELAAAILRTLSSDERAVAISAAEQPESDAHARKTLAKLKRTPETHEPAVVVENCTFSDTTRD